MWGWGGGLERQRNTNLDGGLSGESRRWFESRVVNLDGGLSVVGLASVCWGGGSPRAGRLGEGRCDTGRPMRSRPGSKGRRPGARGAIGCLPEGSVSPISPVGQTGGRGEVRCAGACRGDMGAPSGAAQHVDNGLRACGVVPARPRSEPRGRGIGASLRGVRVRRCGRTLRPQEARQSIRCHGAGGGLGGAAPVSLVANSYSINHDDAEAAARGAGGRAGGTGGSLDPSTADQGRAGRNRALLGKMLCKIFNAA